MNDALRLTREEMTALGERVMKMVVEHFATLGERPVSRTASRKELEERLREPVPRAPRPFDEVLRRIRDDVLENVIHVDHPRNFAFVPGPSAFVGVLGDLLASGFNVFAGTWLEASGPAQIELVTLDWLRSLCGFPDSAGGLFVSGGSAANLTALFVAREEKLPDGPASGTVYFSDQTHSSVERALRVLGLSRGQLRRLPCDERYRLPLESLSSAIASDRARGLRPFAVVANAGTTNTGAVDPLPELAELCRREGLWLHVDGAFGAAAVLSRKAHLLDGLSEVDSLCLDPHKWLFQPYEAGTVILREGALLAKHFHILPEYLKDVKAGEEEVNFCDYGIQLTRSFRALKLWMTFQLVGLDHLRKAVDKGIAMAERAEARLRSKQGFEIVTPAELGVVAFRFVPDDASDPGAIDDRNRRLVEAVMKDGLALVSTTELRGRTVIRICPINPRTTERDLDETIDRIEELAARLA